MGAPPSELEKRAGIATFEKFSFYNIVDALAGKDVLKWSEVLNLTYEQFLLKQMMNKTEADYSKRYGELVEKQKVPAGK